MIRERENYLRDAFFQTNLGIGRAVLLITTIYTPYNDTKWSRWLPLVFSPLMQNEFN